MGSKLTAPTKAVYAYALVNRRSGEIDLWSIRSTRVWVRRSSFWVRSGFEEYKVERIKIRRMKKVKP